MVESPSDIELFDRKLMGLRRVRAMPRFSDCDFLFEWAVRNLRERLDVIHRDFSCVVQLGSRGGGVLPASIISDTGNIFSPGLIADEEFLPFAQQSLDLVVSALNLHSVNDLPGSLLQIKNALKPDGLFLAALFGGETLHELRTALSSAEIDLRGGVSPRVFPFADNQQLGALLQRAGFALPVVDSEIVSVTYENMFKLIADLRGMGETNIIKERDKRYIGKDFFMRAAEHYAQNFAEADGRIVASFEIIFVIGWAPHDSQQKPLQPGSAEERLADVLLTNEKKL